MKHIKTWNLRKRTEKGTYQTISCHSTERRANMARFFYHLFHWFSDTKIGYY